MRRLVFIALFALSASLIASGCDQAREQFASFIRPKTDPSALQEANAALEQGRFQQAIEHATPLAQKAGAARGDAALVVARSSARLGDTDKALAYLRIAADHGAVDPTRLLLDDHFALLRTDPRFLALIVSASPGAATSAQAASAAPQPSAPRVGTPAPAPDAVARVLPGGGLEVRAGDASASVKP
ncbi:TPR end-of-group domain-containing protein [Ramlibacter sp. MAHUQ-53]|uniref:TPR end-of-group domain-containing protein n=1 Tax=unclassified Ramlibacter TaxID=2617605 RepID=UPI003633668E